MKVFETHFDDYIKEVERYNLHPQIHTIFPLELTSMRNMIVYGPSGAGKYSQVLYGIKKYSPTKLKYEKKMCVGYGSIDDYFIVISDIHYEVDMSLLGCNAKTLWSSIYNKIVDSVTTKSNKKGIIVCKNFHEIHTELLDNFYDYMNDNTTIVYILLTEHVGFVPLDIVNGCKIVAIERPSRTKLITCFKKATPNKKNLKNVSGKYPTCSYESLCNDIIDVILNDKEIPYLHLRDCLYKIFIFQHNLGECLWFILQRLIIDDRIKDIEEALLTLYKFLALYNNNYRPIYHLERFIISLYSNVHN